MVHIAPHAQPEVDLNGASSVNCSVTISRPFVDSGISKSSSSDGGGKNGPDGFSLFVVETGGSLSIAFLDFHGTSTSAAAAVHEAQNDDTYSADGSSSGRTSLEDVSGTQGVRALYSAGGNLTVEHCSFRALSTETDGNVGSGYDQVKHGGVVSTVLAVFLVNGVIGACFPASLQHRI